MSRLQIPQEFQKPLVVVWLASVIVLACWIRIPSGEHKPPDGQFTETDGYFYYWQASLISEHGRLPARDMHRWLPVGRDLGQTLNLYGYVLAYAHKTVAWVFPNLSLYHVAVYMPVVCFGIGLGALCLFLYHVYGRFFSLTVGVILATLPGSIERSTAGFGDRDAFCLMIGILVVVTYLTALRAASLRQRLFWTLLSGITAFLGGLSWEGFGVFLSVIIVVELYRFLTSETEQGLGLYLLWVLTFVPTLYLASAAYWRGYAFSEHLAAFLLLPPVVLFAIRALRYLLVSKVDRFRQHARTLSLGFTLTCVMLAVGYVLIQHQTFESTTVPLSQSTLMQAMTELRAPHYGYWVYRYGSVFILGSIGCGILAFSLSDQKVDRHCSSRVLTFLRHRLFLTIGLAGFTVFTFFREQGDRVWSEPIGNTLFGLTLAGCAVGFVVLAWRKQTAAKNDYTTIAFITWFIVWVALARDAKRYDFFIGVALAFGTAAFIEAITALLSEKLHQSVYVTDQFRQDFTPVRLKTMTAVILLILLMGLPTQYAHTYRARETAETMRTVKPSVKVAMALFWMKNRLPRTSVVAAHWAFGSQLNVLGGVKTITDQDTYIPHWVHLYSEHVHKAATESETLAFLKTHGATHLMLTGKDPKDSRLRGELSEAFSAVFPKTKFADAEVKVWQIQYPPEIKTDVKYLKTGLRELDAEIQPK